MPQREVRDHSPYRIFERATQGGLGRGNIGVVLSRAGVGKTAFVIGLALDALLQGRQVLHISTRETVADVRRFYDQLFQAMAQDLGLPDRSERLLELERNRHILVYNREQFSLAKLEQSAAFLRQAAHFTPSLVVMDGTPRYEHTEAWELEGVQRLARQWDAEIWTSSLVHREGQDHDARGVPLAMAKLDRFLALIVLLESRGDHVRVRLLKDHDRAVPADLRMELDPATLMLRWQ